MVTGNDQVPGIRFNIGELKMKTEPSVFGIEYQMMQRWLRELGFAEVRTVDQQELEKMYRTGIRLPKQMWYCVSAKTA